MHNASEKSPFLSGVTALTLSTVAVKVIGLVYKIPMMRYLGAEGMGYFNAAYELYTLFFVIATAGLPVAVSVLISKSLARGSHGNARKIYRISFSLFFLLGLAGTLVLSFGARWLSEWIEAPNARLCIAFIAPTVFFVSVASAVRGYFQGNQNMMPTAVSQVVEALGKLLFGVLLAAWAVSRGWSAPSASALAVLGLVIGSALSMLYLLLRVAFERNARSGAPREETDHAGQILRNLLVLAVPVTVGACLSGFTRIVDMTLILRRLPDPGYGGVSATAAFGCYSTLAVPIYHLPTSLIAGIALSLVPTLAAAVERGDQAKQNDLIHTALRLCGFISVPSAFGLALFSAPILSLLFAGESESVRAAAPWLSLLGFSVPSACLLGVTNSVLQANRRETFPIVSMLVGLAVKGIVGYVLMGLPSIGMMAAPISTLLCNLTAVGLNFWMIGRVGAYSDPLLSVLSKPMLPTAVAMAVALGIYLPLCGTEHRSAIFAVAVAACGVVYLLMARLTGALEKQDIAVLTGRKKTE